MERERSQELAQGDAGEGRMEDGGFTHLGMDLCRDHLMGSKNCAKAGLCSCERQEGLAEKVGTAGRRGAPGATRKEEGIGEEKGPARE